MSKRGALADEGSGDGVLLVGVSRKIESPRSADSSTRLGPLDYLTIFTLVVGIAAVLWTLVH